MEQPGTETQNSRKKHGSLPLIGAAIVVAVYFCFPAILLYPVVLVYPDPNSAPAYVRNGISVVFYPVFKIAEIIPEYGDLLHWEFDLLGIR